MFLYHLVNIIDCLGRHAFFVLFPRKLVSVLSEPCYVNKTTTLSHLLCVLAKSFTCTCVCVLVHVPIGKMRAEGDKRERRKEGDRERERER